MQEHPGLCRGCFVVLTTDVLPESLASSPSIAAFAKASSPEDSCSRASLWLAASLCFLNSIIFDEIKN